MGACMVVREEARVGACVVVGVRVVVIDEMTDRNHGDSNSPVLMRR